MTVTSEPMPKRFGIFTRARGQRWTLVVHVGDHDAALRLMVQLAAEAKGSADWCCRALSQSPRDDAIGTAPDPATTRGSIAPQRRT